MPALASMMASGVLYAPRAICVMPTAAPATGSATAAASPAPSPLAKPDQPSDLAPTTGAAMRAAAPPSTPLPTDCMPEDRPDMMFWGRRSDMKSLRSIWGIEGRHGVSSEGGARGVSRASVEEWGAHLRLGASLSGDGGRGDAGKRDQGTLRVLHHLGIGAGDAPGRAASRHACALSDL